MPWTNVPAGTLKALTDQTIPKLLGGDTPVPRFFMTGDGHGSPPFSWTTVCDTLVEATDQLEAVATVTAGVTGVIETVVMDKGYHRNHVLVGLTAAGVRTCVAEPARGRRRWRGQPDARAAVSANRRRITSARGRALQRQRSLRLEQPNAHLYETGGMRRTHLRGHANITKRLLVHVAAFNLALLMRHIGGVGTPRGLQGRAAHVAAILVACWTVLVARILPLELPVRTTSASLRIAWRWELRPVALPGPPLTTGC